ncbi:MAG: ABC transporter permease subunit [Chloroflexi bacterium]|nr:ABC transporter permease subunit [Chloroflexota bacterium]
MSQDSRIQVVTRSNIPLWRDERVIQGIAQVVSAVLVIGFIIFFVSNVFQAAQDRGLSLGYDFVRGSAGFPLAESVIPYDESMSFGYAFLVGILNTVKAAVVGVVLATILGTITALARLSTNWLVSKIASAYIELIRNIPLLVQLFIWYFAVFQNLPIVKESIQWPGPIYLSQRGVYMPAPVPTSTFRTWITFVVIAIVLAVVLRIVLGRYQLKTGRSTYPVATAIVVLLVLPAVGWFIGGTSPLVADFPVMGKFNFEGGMRLTTEYAALLAGLVIYTGAFIAEVVRAGIMAVNRGQFEAARAVGLNDMQVLRLVVFPQAMRVIIPPLISQYLNLTKNSSLAIAVGYPDLFFVGRTIINQAGRAVPVFLMVMGVYLFTSLTTSFLMNIYNRRIQLVER